MFVLLHVSAAKIMILSDRASGAKKWSRWVDNAGVLVNVLCVLETPFFLQIRTSVLRIRDLARREPDPGGVLSLNVSKYCLFSMFSKTYPT